MTENFINQLTNIAAKKKKKNGKVGFPDLVDISQCVHYMQDCMKDQVFAQDVMINSQCFIFL